MNKEDYIQDHEVKRIFHDWLSKDASWDSVDRHIGANLDLLAHYYPGMDDETKRRAMKTMAKLERQQQDRLIDMARKLMVGR